MLMILMDNRKSKEVVSEAGSGTIDQPATNTGMDEPSEPVKTVTFHTTQVTALNAQFNCYSVIHLT